MAAARARLQASHTHLHNGGQLRAQGRLKEAMAEYEAARLIDPATPAVDQDVATTPEMLQRNTLPEMRGLTPSQQMGKRATRGSLVFWRRQSWIRR